MHFVPRSYDVNCNSVEVLNSPDGQLKLIGSYSLNCKGGEVQPLVKFEFKAHRMKFAEMYLMIPISQFEQFHILL